MLIFSVMKMSITSQLRCIGTLIGPLQVHSNERKPNLNPIIIVSLIPFFVFSVFHSLTYFRSNIVHHIPIDKEYITERIQVFTDTCYADALRYMAYVEVVLILGRILLGVVL